MPIRTALPFAFAIHSSQYRAHIDAIDRLANTAHKHVLFLALREVNTTRRPTADQKVRADLKGLSPINGCGVYRRSGPGFR